MYPGTIFNWHDNSAFQVATSTENTTRPLLMQIFSSDKGTEDFIEIEGDNFDAMYGTMSFTRHGQSAIQAKNIIDAGGRLFAKRVVADDSLLANLVLIATVTASGDDVKVTWESKAITGCKTFAEVKTQALAMLDITNGKFPLFIYTDNGRGVSSKAIRLTPDYSTSKSIGHTFYTLSVCEGTDISEKKSITVDPTVVYSNVSYRLDEYTNTQISGYVDSDVYDAYVEKLAETLVIDPEVLRTYDVIYGYTYRGAAIPHFVLDTAGVDLDAETGIALTNGSNGAFGDAPVGTTAWTQAMVDALTNKSGEYDEIYDVDRHKIGVVLDANYPTAVKNALYDLVEFRKDCVFLRDYGLGMTTFAEINAKHSELTEDYANYFTADYYTTYMIKDPTTKKNIEVTMLYDLAALCVNHIERNSFAPLAGTINGMILPNAIKGTISFTPVNTPKVNQKEAIDNIRVNYAIFQDNQCVVQSCYTSQKVDTQLSYVSNVISIQTVLRAIRIACPKQRFALSTGTDLQSYADAVNEVLSNFTTNFSILNFVYTQDDLKASQKIFYASIEFAFLNWAQTEIFDIYAINNFNINSNSVTS